MGFFKKHILPHTKAVLSGGLSLASRKERNAYRHASKSLRKKVGFTGSRIKKLFGRSAVASPVATSATTEGYHHTSRTLSQLTGGV